MSGISYTTPTSADSFLHAPNPVGSESFPVLVLDVRDGVSTPPRLGFKQMHWHEDLQFIVVTGGKTKIDASGFHFECERGQGAFFNSGVPHRILSDREARYTSFVFPSKLLDFFPGSDMHAFGVAPFVGKHAQPVMHFSLEEPWHAQVLSNLKQARELLVGEEHSGSERYHGCVRLLNAWATYIANIQQVVPTKPEQAANERMKAFTLFVDQHFSEDITLDDIARAGAVSKAECARCFKRILNTTPYAYVLEYRISKSIDLMYEGNLNATAIAQRVGFGSSSHFSTAFKKSLGMSPREYMNAIRANEA